MSSKNSEETLIQQQGKPSEKYKTKKRKKKKYDKWFILQVILMVSAAGVLLYPILSGSVFIRKNVEIIQEFTNDTQENIQERYNTMLERNSQISDANFYTQDPFLEDELPEHNSADIPSLFGREFSEVEGRYPVIGVLKIPKIGEELPIYAESTSSTLNVGVGVLGGTHQPTGGIGNTSVLTGHRGLSNATLFENLDELEIGDTFTVDNGVEELHYEVYAEYIVLPNETDVIQRIPGQDTVILLTCDTPDPSKGLNTHRLVYYGRRVLHPKDQDAVTGRYNKFYKLMLGVMLIVFILILVILREVQKNVERVNEGTVKSKEETTSKRTEERTNK